MTINPDFAQNLGGRIRVERKRLGLTQAEFAKRVGVKVLAQGAYEGGRREPRASYFELAAKIGADSVYLLTGNRLAANPTQIAMRKAEMDAFSLLDEEMLTKFGSLLKGTDRYFVFDSLRDRLLLSIN
ncbi:helix-turn-helix domain-containing protein [Polynucleobacter asymbioticus]|jgi:transcriptional regulator with XRE-family HTH domain|uniref:HTH cro/C1-type domain-containing protein n=1 Tax=Polynucleobacter asymbioticus TaxID=576611 RepID=A0AAC9IW53_9BURK|nr:helix-turn-helix transcriptional regulator [Polynucleobacter asymbioticus]APB99647.1 hypothetical protein A4F89_10030 [Polynucleobacter asymbioticus]APC01953.1 hypothetical protein AOC25_10165 [Polynucleobacter asymbioticus]